MLIVIALALLLSGLFLLPTLPDLNFEIDVPGGLLDLGVFYLGN